MPWRRRWRDEGGRLASEAARRRLKMRDYGFNFQNSQYDYSFSIKSESRSSAERPRFGDFQNSR